MKFCPLKTISKINDCASIPQIRYCFNLNKWIAEDVDSYGALMLKIDEIRSRMEYNDDLIQDLIWDIEIHRERCGITGLENDSRQTVCISCGKLIKNEGRRTKKFCNHKCYYIYLRKKFNK